MMRLWAPLVLLGIISGCTNPGAGNRPTDPFFGRTRVEPPGTGWAQGQRSPDPYYSNTRPSTGAYGTAGAGAGAPASTIGPPSVTLPAAGSAQPPAGYQPPGGWQVPGGVQGPTTSQPATPTPAPTINLSAPQGTSSNSAILPGAAIHRPGDRIEIPLAARQGDNSPLTTASRDNASLRLGPPAEADRSQASAAAAVSSTTASAASLAASNPRYGSNAAAPNLSGRERIVRVLEPRPATTAGRSAAAIRTSESNSSPTTAFTRQAVDIMDLPPVGAADPYRGSQSSGSTGQVQLISAAELANASRTADGSSPVKRLGD